MTRNILKQELSQKLRQRLRRSLRRKPSTNTWDYRQRMPITMANEFKILPGMTNPVTLPVNRLHSHSQDIYGLAKLIFFIITS